ncbi:MAG TPA: ADOP family duplicated permease [Vicinamibacterales bacterium]|nr:ADOP family duplicated permease [Vicinamibacterales bacterium]
MSRGTPPRLPSLMLRVALDPDIAEFVLGDLDEEFLERAAQMGRPRARRWYWKQAVTSAIRGCRLARGTRRPPRPASREKRFVMPIQDVIYGLRSFARRPGFTSLVIFILALGISFVTVVAGLAHSIFWGSVPYREPERIVMLWRKGPEPIHLREATSYVNIRDWAEGGAGVFDGVAAYTIGTSSIQRTEGAVRVMVTRVDPYFFEALDVDMAVGRPLIEADTRPSADDEIVVLSYGIWQSVFGGDPDIEGKSIDLGGRPYTVVGVMAPRTRWLLHEPLDVVVPIRPTSGMYQNRRANMLIAVGRLREGVTVEQAQARMRVVSLALQEEYPDANAGIEADVTSFADLRGDFGRLNEVVTVLGIAAGLVFLLSCISVTLLLLARFVERSREFAVRMALGATPRRFVYQTLAEGVSITLVAGAVGLGLAYAGIKLVFAGNPLNMYSFTDVRVHGSVFLLALLLALATTLLFGIVAMLRRTRSNFHDTLRPAGVGGGSRERNWLRRGLVIMQVAVSVAVLAGAGLVGRSLYVFTHTDYGFDTDHLVYVRLLLDGPQYDADRLRVAYRELEGRLAALPDVSDFGLWGPGLPGSSTSFRTLVPEGRETDPSFAGLHTWFHFVMPGSMERLGLRLLEGRMFDETDHAGALPSMVLSQSAARALWPGERAVGKRVVDQGGGWRTVVGVVSDARMRGMGRIHSEMLRDSYITLDQSPSPRTNIFLRATGSRAAVVNMVRNVVREIDPTRALFEVSTMDESMAEDRREMGFITTLMALFAVTTAILTTVTVYSAMSYATSRRTHEIGVRVALGGTKAHVVGLVLNRAVLDMALGLTVGGVSALALSRVMSGLLYGVTPTDPVAFILIGPALTAIALVAAFVPVRRALAVDPAEALRNH